MALKRAIDSSHVETRARFSNLARRAPDVKEHLTDEVLRDCLIAHHALDEAKHFSAVAGEQDMHGRLVALRNMLEQHGVGGVLFLVRRVANGVSELAMARLVRLFG